MLAKKQMDAVVLRQKALSSNLANAQVPHYKRIDVDPSFDQQLTQCLAEGDLKGFQELRPATYTDEKSSCQANGNNVEIDRELLQLNENAVKHQFLLKVAEENVAGSRHTCPSGRYAASSGTRSAPPRRRS